jgi:hypothetical protein
MPPRFPSNPFGAAGLGGYNRGQKGPDQPYEQWIFTQATYGWAWEALQPNRLILEGMKRPPRGGHLVQIGAEQGIVP